LKEATFSCVVVEDAELEVVQTSDKPVVASDKFDASHWSLCNFKGFDDCTGFVVVNVDGAFVETG
jgi:hypothetical protein